MTGHKNTCKMSNGSSVQGQFTSAPRVSGTSHSFSGTSARSWALVEFCIFFDLSHVDIESTVVDKSNLIADSNKAYMYLKTVLPLLFRNAGFQSYVTPKFQNMWVFMLIWIWTIFEIQDRFNKGWRVDLLHTYRENVGYVPDDPRFDWKPLT